MQARISPFSTETRLLKTPFYYQPTTLNRPGHTDVEAVVQHILRVRQAGTGQSGKPRAELMSKFNKAALLPRFVAELENHENSTRKH